MPSPKRATILFTALSATLVCLLLYLPVLQYGFINFDDPEYVLNNPVIRQLGPDSLAQMFSHAHVGWWMPLTWTSLAVDYHFWGVNPVGYHLTNILLHALNTGIVVLIADQASRTASRNGSIPLGSTYIYCGILFFTGLFFGVHPLRVESVAWVTERKDVLNGLFAFSAVLCYLHYTDRKIAGAGGGRGFFAMSLFCFVCSLMCKSISVLLPAILLVLDWTPLGRLRSGSLWRLVLEKWPFWVASVLMTLITFFFAAQSRYLVTYEAFPLVQRVMVSGNAIWEYAHLLILPIGLSPFNVIPDPIPTSYAVATVSVAVALAGIFFSRRTPRLVACVICFLLAILPVLAFFQNGDQSYADRFTYLPALAPSLFLALFLNTSPLISDSPPLRRLVTVGGVCLIMVFMFATSRQMKVWQTPESFWTRIIQIEPLAIIYKERGKYYHSVGRYVEAVADFTAALARITPTLKPYEYNFYAFRAESLRESGKLVDAVRDFTMAIGQHPYPAYYYHRGLALRAIGRNAEADEDFLRAGSDPGAIIWID